MKNKNILLTLTSIVALIVTLSLVSATITISAPTLSKTSGSNSVDITIDSNKNETIHFNSISSITEDGRTITFSTPSDIAINDSDSKEVTISYNIPSGFEFKLGKTYQTTLSLNGSESGQKTQTLSFGSSNEYCEVSNRGNLDVQIKDIQVNGFSTDDDEFYPGDEIEVEVKIENNGDEDIDNIEIEWALYTSDGTLIDEDSEDDVDVRDGDDETVTFTITIDPTDLDVDEENYILYVRGTGEDQEDDRDVCSSDSQDLSLILSRDFVILRDIKVPDVAQCGGQAQVNARVWNIGEDDQDDIIVRVYISQFGYDRDFEVGDIDALDDSRFSALIDIPSNVSQGSYTVAFEVLDENGDIYESEDDDESRFSETLRVEGGSCGIPSSRATITAEIQSGGRAGEELIINARITNTGNSLSTYTVNVVGYENWASSAQAAPSTLSISAGETRESTISLNVNNGVEGEQTFTVQLLSGGQVVVQQPVSVEVTKSAFNFNLGGSWYLWAIAIVNIILVVVIIIVAIRVARS